MRSVSFAQVQSAQTQVLAQPDENQPVEMQTYPPVPAVGLASVTPLREDDKLAAGRAANGEDLALYSRASFWAVCDGMVFGADQFFFGG